jgi:hypothetical protein
MVFIFRARKAPYYNVHLRILVEFTYEHLLIVQNIYISSSKSKSIFIVYQTEISKGYKNTEGKIGRRNTVNM